MSNYELLILEKCNSSLIPFKKALPHMDEKVIFKLPILLIDKTNNISVISDSPTTLTALQTSLQCWTNNLVKEQNTKFFQISRQTHPLTTFHRTTYTCSKNNKYNLDLLTLLMLICGKIEFRKTCFKDLF